VPKLFSSQSQSQSLGYPSNNFHSLEKERGGYSGGKGAERLGMEGRDKGTAFTMMTVTAGGGGRKVAGGGESQDDLTIGWEYRHERVLVAKVAVHDMA
jgi:hypothetical protein